MTRIPGHKEADVWQHRGRIENRLDRLVVVERTDHGNRERVRALEGHGRGKDDGNIRYDGCVHPGRSHQRRQVLVVHERRRCPATQPALQPLPRTPSGVEESRRVGVHDDLLASAPGVPEYG